MSKNKNYEILEKHKPELNAGQNTTAKEDQERNDYIEYLEGKGKWQPEYIKWSLNNQND